MTRRKTVLDPATQCESEVQDNESRAWRNKVGATLRCTAVWKYKICGKKLCKRHASQEALAILVSEGQVNG